MITTADDVHRFDFPDIATYTGFSTGESLTNIIREEDATSEVVSVAESPTEMKGGLSVNTITTTGNIDVGGLFLAPNQVSFKASRTTDKTVNTGIELPFDRVLYNNGNGYDNTTYIFTAPASGIYFFYTQFFTISNNNYTVDFLLNEEIIYRVQRAQNGAGATTTVSASFTIQLNSGDEVDLKRNSGGIGLYQYPYSQWGGHLLALKYYIINLLSRNIIYGLSKSIDKVLY